MMSSKSQIACKGIFSLYIPSFRSEKDMEKKKEQGQQEEKERGPNTEPVEQKGIPSLRDGSGSIGVTGNRPLEDQPKDKNVNTMGQETRRPRLGLLTSLLPMLTSSRSDSRFSAEIPRKPVPAVPGTYIAYTPPTTNTTMSTPNTTSRTSEDSKSSSHYESTTTFTPLSPTEQGSLFPENELVESPEQAPKKLQKIPTMPSAPPPPPPTVLTKRPDTPPCVPTVTAIHATPPTGRRVADRSPSPEAPPPGAKLQPNRLQPRHVSPNPRGRSVSAQPPMVRNVSVDGSRAVSSPVHRRSQSKHSSESSPTGATDRRKARRSWFPGGRSRANSDVDTKPKAYGAWTLAPDTQVDYNTALLVNGEKVCGSALGWVLRGGELTLYPGT